MTRKYGKGYGHGPIICGICGQPQRDHPSVAHFCHLRLYPNQPTSPGADRCDWCGHEYHRRSVRQHYCSHVCNGRAQTTALRQRRGTDYPRKNGRPKKG